MEKSKDIQEPQNHQNDHDSIQDRLNRSCHGYETIDQPEENTHDDQNQEYINQRHDLLTSLILEADAYMSAPRYALLSIACGFSVRAAMVESPGASGNPRHSA
jgi:hypothetical protein